MIHVDFKAAHHWLRGYSDALLHKPEKAVDPAYDLVYSRGYTVGLKARADF